MSALLDAHAVAGRLQDRVGLGVDRADAVVVVHQAADLAAVRQAADRAVVAGGQHGLVAHDDRAHALARARRARRRLHGEVHEVAVPRDPLHGGSVPANGADPPLGLSRLAADSPTPVRADKVRANLRRAARDQAVRPFLHQRTRKSGPAGSAARRDLGASEARGTRRGDGASRANHDSAIELNQALARRDGTASPGTRRRKAVGGVSPPGRREVGSQA